ncbi:MAG TPA: nickel pincer cofactor biosynthesis protein LarB [Acidimicrobiales bacterium]|nr:nickel pincer cofactor biosynthesis protein LarB [Acidimicrobiales bacterium]
MDDNELSELLERVRDGSVQTDAAVERLRRLPFADLGFARVDHHRPLRQGLPEAVLGQGKTPGQCAAIVAEMLEHGSGPVLLTRADRDQVTTTLDRCPGGRVTPDLADLTRMFVVGWRPAPARPEHVVVVTAGTADLPVAHECSATLSAFGFAPTLVADSGVAGIHRLLANETEIARCDAVVVVAGMEGALASVVGGMSPAPVIAVPTSVGYGASLTGVTALLAMLASCAPGVTVVGIDNGFGAACAVSRALR